jgi:mRNA-degrading endonuclease RelE of RelBE toxin-antitoxin system
MSFNIIPTPPFEKELKYLAKKYPSIKKDMAELVSKLMKNPNWELLLVMIVIK